MHMFLTSFFIPVFVLIPFSSYSCFLLLNILQFPKLEGIFNGNSFLRLIAIQKSVQNKNKQMYVQQRMR